MTFERKNNNSFGISRRNFGFIFAFIVIGFCFLNGRVTAQQNPDLYKVDLTGDWVGTITHGNDIYSHTYDYTLRIEQNGKTISGASFAEAVTANNVSVSVSFEVKGQNENRKVRIKDSKIISSKMSSKDSPYGWWCVKTIDLTLIQGSPLKLEGSWKAKTQFDPFNPLNSIIPSDSTNSRNSKCIGGIISLTKASLPTPFTDTPKYGTVAYYDFRNNDYIKRNPQKSPPTYYLNFGKKNLNKFMTELYPNVSPQGKVFLTTVAIILQKKIEDRLNRNPKTFAELEDNSAAFQKFAYETHYPAYCESGWGNLSTADQTKIVWAIDWTRDLFNKNGVKVGWQLLNCSNYKKPEEPKKPNPVKEKLKGIWNQIKTP